MRPSSKTIADYAYALCLEREGLMHEDMPVAVWLRECLAYAIGIAEQLTERYQRNYGYAFARILRRAGIVESVLGCPCGRCRD